MATLVEPLINRIGDANAAADMFAQEGGEDAAAEGQSGWLSDSQWRDAELEYYRELGVEAEEPVTELQSVAQAKRLQQLARRVWRVPEHAYGAQRLRQPSVRARCCRRAGSKRPFRGRGHHARRSRPRGRRVAPTGRGDPDPGSKSARLTQWCHGFRRRRAASQTSATRRDKRPSGLSVKPIAGGWTPPLECIVALWRDA